MIKTRTPAPPSWPRCRCRPPSTATRRTPSPTPTPSSSPRPCSTWGWAPCRTSLLGSWRPTSHQGRFIIFSFFSQQMLDISCFTSLISDLMPSLAGMSSLMSSSFAAMTPFSGQAYTQLTASAKWGNLQTTIFQSSLLTFRLFFVCFLIIQCYQFMRHIATLLMCMYRWRRFKL